MADGIDEISVIFSVSGIAVTDIAGSGGKGGGTTCCIAAMNYKVHAGIAMLQCVGSVFVFVITGSATKEVDS